MSKYVLMRGTFVEVSDDELLHYGVKGMKWGVRKEEYKAMDRQQKKKTREEYYQTPEGKRYKNIRNTVIGTLLAGPIGGVAVGLITAHRNGSLQKSVSNGKEYVENLVTKKEITVTNKTESKRVAAIKERVTGKKSDGKPIFLMNDQEREQFDAQYETRRNDLIKRARNASNESTKARLFDEIDRLENDYLDIVEQDFWYSDD